VNRARIGNPHDLPAGDVVDVFYGDLFRRSERMLGDSRPIYGRGHRPALGGSVAAARHGAERAPIPVRTSTGCSTTPATTSCRTVGHTGSALAVTATWFLGRPSRSGGGADATVRVWDLSGQYDQPAEAIRDIELNAVVLGLAEGPDGLVIATTSEGVAALDHHGTPDP
jgi:hypothetical protein